MAEDKDKHRIGPDGIRSDGVATYPADAHDMQLFEQAKRQLAQQSVPVLIHAGNPHERLYVTAFDGTGNDANRDRAHLTNIGTVRGQIVAARKAGHEQVQVGYVEGPGTQTNALTRTVDGATGYSYEQRLEKMYLLLARQAKDWIRQDPHAQIRIADIGFSRGAEQAAGFARLVHERGIVDPDSKVTGKDVHGRDVVSYTRTLVAPGQVPQIAALIDPVATGVPSHHDRRLPPSVISGLQLTTEDEHRSLFKVSQHMDMGLTEDGRFNDVFVPGAHSDAGGGYHRSGLAIRSGNLLVDYLNAASDTPFLHKQAEPGDPRMNVVHRSEEGLLLYRITPRVDRRRADGVVEALAQGPMCRVVDCLDAEPIDHRLSAPFERRNVPIGATPSHAGPDAPVPDERANKLPANNAHIDELFQQLSTAAVRGDHQSARDVGNAYLQSGDGQMLQLQGRQHAESLRAQEQVATPETQHAMLAAHPLQAHAAPMLRR